MTPALFLTFVQIVAGLAGAGVSIMTVAPKLAELIRENATPENVAHARKSDPEAHAAAFAALPYGYLPGGSEDPQTQLAPNDPLRFA